jgi:hypothetical protein
MFTRLCRTRCCWFSVSSGHSWAGCIPVAFSSGVIEEGQGGCGIIGLISCTDMLDFGEHLQQSFNASYR